MRSRFQSFLLLLTCLLFIFSTEAQQQKYTLPQVTPHSPNAASLDKYGEIPVTLSSGMANVAVPLFDIKCGNLSIPIALSYHNNGLKVDEIPSWVGLGWDLRAGGVINFQQHGLADFSADGVFRSPSKDSLRKYLGNQMDELAKLKYYEKIIKGQIDSEHDLYSYNFLGYSGTFYFDTGKNIVCVPETNLKFYHDADLTDAGFHVVDEKGNTYYFFSAEINLMAADASSDIFLQRDFNSGSSFLLSSIKTAENRVINFGYTNYTLTYNKQSNVYAFASNSLHQECPESGMSFGTTAFQHDNLLLNGISFEGGYAVFEHSTDWREDIKKVELNPASHMPFLKKVKLYNSDSVLVNEYTLLYSYFGNNSRLKLDKVLQTIDSSNLKTWSFEYNNAGEQFPALFAKSKDHWGYYNGPTSAATSIPTGPYKTLLYNWASETESWMQNRRSNFGYGLYGTLKKITYPTGGTSSFDYEPNQFQIRSYSEMPGVFLEYNELEHGTQTNIVAVSTDYDAVLNGSFTLATAKTIRVIASKEYNPYYFIDSRISLSQTPGGADIIESQLGYTYASGVYTAQGSITLAAGTYYYHLERNAAWEELDEPLTGYATLQLSAIEYDSLIPYTVGGCRIRKVINSNASGNTTVRMYQYNDRLDSLLFRSIPYYILNTGIMVGTAYLPCNDCGIVNYLHDESVVPMAGNDIQYKYVSELVDSMGLGGKTRYEFLADENLTAQNGFPYVQPFLSTWKAGVQKDKKVYKYSASGYMLVEQDTSVYVSSAASDGVTKGVKAGYLRHCLSEPAISDPYYNGSTYGIAEANYQTEHFYNSNTIKIMPVNADRITQAVTNNFLSSHHLLPTVIVSPDSKDKDRMQRFKYSFDYDTLAAAGAEAWAIRKMYRNNILIPVEQLNTQVRDGNEYVLAGTITLYDSGLLVPAVVKELVLPEPVLYSSFVESYINGSGTLVFDSHYQDKAFLSKYDAYHNILEQRLADNVIQSFVYDHRMLYPIASVTGASVNDIAFTSFEADGKGNWLFAGPPVTTDFLTGGKAYNLAAGNISKSGLNTSEVYRVSCWKKDGSGSVSVNGNSGVTVLSKNGWTLYYYQVSGNSTVDISGTGIIDELRLLPYGAQMTTYTYKPLVGLTSQSDADNHITYFEYDEAGLLRTIRDQDKNIMKSFKYRYQETAY